MTTDERIAALEARIDELQAQLARLGQRTSMHQTSTCPACGNGRVLAVNQVRSPTGMGGVPLALKAYKRWLEGPEGDVLHVYVCTACRHVEWRVHSLVHLTPDGETVVELRRSTESAVNDSPYR